VASPLQLVGAARLQLVEGYRPLQLLVPALRAFWLLVCVSDPFRVGKYTFVPLAINVGPLRGLTNQQLLWPSTNPLLFSLHSAHENQQPTTNN